MGLFPDVSCAHVPKAHVPEVVPEVVPNLAFLVCRVSSWAALVVVVVLFFWAGLVSWVLLSPVVSFAPKALVRFAKALLLVSPVVVSPVLQAQNFLKCSRFPCPIRWEFQLPFLNIN